MEKVLGFGGFFFRAQDPAMLKQWYHQHLGIDPVPSKAGDEVWQQQAGPTAFSPFKATTKYWEPETQQWMLNFRVASMERMVAQLRAAGIEVTVSPDESMGLFARLYDPEGNPIELWESTD